MMMVNADTKAVFEELRKDLTLASLHFNVFRTLYASDPADVNLMNAVAPGTFWVVEDSLHDSVVLRLARLTDARKTASQENLTLETLIEGAEKDGETRLVQQLRDKYRDVKSRVAPIRKLRHKVTGHTDSPTRRGAVAVPTVRLSELTDAVKSVEEFLNVFESAVNGSQTVYALSIMDGEAEVLLRRLREALAFREEVSDWHMLGNPQRQRIRELLKNAQPEDGVKT
jgi:AbiU2